MVVVEVGAGAEVEEGEEVDNKNLKKGGTGRVLTEYEKKYKKTKI